MVLKQVHDTTDILELLDGFFCFASWAARTEKTVGKYRKKTSKILISFQYLACRQKLMCKHLP